MLGIFKKIYNIIPSSVSGPIVRGLKIGPSFSAKNWRRVEVIAKEDKRPLSIDYIENRLRSSHSGLNKIKYYNDNPEYKEYIRKPAINLLLRLPLLDEQRVRYSADSLTNRGIPGYTTSTGGAGGSPKKIYLSNESYFIDRAYVCYAWSRNGYGKGDMKLTLRGVDMGGELTQYNPWNNELLINIFNINAGNVSEIIKSVNHHKPVFGHGYSSAWYNLACLMSNNGLKLCRRLKGIYFASESVDNNKREFVENVFETRARSTYGSTERVAFAYEKTEKSNLYTIMHGYGLVEVLDESGSQVREGERGEIVCTGFVNKAMPLIRYKTGDYADVSRLNSGIVTEITNIVGRWGKDYIEDADGNKIYTTAINIHLSAQTKLRYLQLKQYRKGDLEIAIVPTTAISSTLIASIKKAFQRKMPTINVVVHVVEDKDIYRTHRGKVPYLVKGSEDKIGPR